MSEITTLFWDIGGVILTNGWDHNSRMEAAQTFGLDWEEFRERHDLSFPAFDAGQITLNQYLDRTLFYRATFLHTGRVHGLHVCPVQGISGDARQSFRTWRGAGNITWHRSIMNRGN